MESSSKYLEEDNALTAGHEAANQ
jgi:hypothetical protein